MTFIFLLKDNTGLFSSQSLDFSNQYNNVTKSSEHSLDPSFGDTVLNIMLSFSNYCILLACGILMYQMPIRFIYNIQIKVTLHILHILQNKKGKYQNTIQEQSCAKVILSTCEKTPRQDSQFVEIHKIFLQMCFYSPSRYSWWEYIYFRLFITSGYSYFFICLHGKTCF